MPENNKNNENKGGQSGQGGSQGDNNGGINKGGSDQLNERRQENFSQGENKNSLPTFQNPPPPPPKKSEGGQ